MRFSSHNVRYHYLLSVKEAKRLGVLWPIAGWFKALWDYISIPQFSVPPCLHPYQHQKQLVKAPAAIATSSVCSLLGTPRISQCIEKWHWALRVFKDAVPPSRLPMAGARWAGPRARQTARTSEVHRLLSFLSLLSLPHISFLSVEGKSTLLEFLPTHTIIVFTITPQLLRNHIKGKLDWVNATSPVEEPI